MNSIEIVAATAIVFVFVLGITIGVVLVVSFASRREDRRMSLWGEAPDPACQGARRLVGAGVRGGVPAAGINGYAGPSQELQR